MAKGFRSIIARWLGGLSAPSSSPPPAPKKGGIWVSAEYLKKLAEEEAKRFVKYEAPVRRSIIRRVIDPIILKRIKAQKTVVASAAPQNYDEEIEIILLESL